MDEDKENIELYLTKGGKQIGKRAYEEVKVGRVGEGGVKRRIGKEAY